MNGRTWPVALERTIVWQATALLLVAAAVVGLGSEYFFLVLGVASGLLVVTWRPHWGVATLLITFLIQYGVRPRRGGDIWAFVQLPRGTGLVTLNNLLGLFLGLLLAYRIYRTGDWSFLRSRQVQVVALITAVLALSALINPLDLEALAAAGLRVPTYNPVRLVISRFLFLVLFVAFVRGPREVRLMVGIFLTLSLAAALGGIAQALTGGIWKARVAEYRAGGPAVLLAGAINPNRLAMLSTLAMIFVWEYSRVMKLSWTWIPYAGVLILSVTVFLTASRGGVLGLAAAWVLLIVRQRRLGGRWLRSLVMAAIALALAVETVPTANWERLTSLPGFVEGGEEGGGSIQRRQYAITVALRVAAQHPLLGIGLGNWEYVRFHTDPSRSTAPPHNSFVLTIAEAGLPCLLLYLGLFWLTIRELAQIERSPERMALADDQRLGWIVRSIRVCLGAFLVFSLFADLWELAYFYFLFGLAAVLIRRYGSVRPYVAV
jgi:O-antigen ligase